MDSKILIVTGMHRSGTSLMAEYLSECGLFVGSDLLNLAAASTDSAYNGHHEDKAFFDLHDKMLKRLHTSPFPRYQFRLTNRFNASEKQTAIALVQARKHLSQWGWKDPRTALFLNAWHDVIPEAKHLLLIRNPLSVADSLIRRATDKQIVGRPVIGLRAWIVYNYRICSFLKHHSDGCLLCDIDDLIAHPQSICRLIEKQLDLELTPVPFETVFSQKGFRTGYSEAVNQLKTQHGKEVAKALKLYEELREIASTQANSLSV
ncbi:MAG: sulfotransferase [Phormidesmis sp.]